ncbi:hypothetical protein VTK73DRAFT_3701 [Phialemonium thermophilum]|uniref:Uncharacterized protein n=1 Tax=Phialemonium thermophilum TaxID=223376 RepID=A0ABR3VFN2_9PEZI
MTKPQFPTSALRALHTPTAGPLLDCADAAVEATGRLSGLFCEQAEFRKGKSTLGDGGPLQRQNVTAREGTTGSNPRTRNKLPRKGKKKGNKKKPVSRTRVAGGTGFHPNLDGLESFAISICPPYCHAFAGTPFDPM